MGGVALLASYDAATSFGDNSNPMVVLMPGTIYLFGTMTVLYVSRCAALCALVLVLCSCDFSFALILVWFCVVVACQFARAGVGWYTGDGTRCNSLFEFWLDGC